jgi:hypothetical protein
MTQGVQKQVGTLPAIETELHLFQVGGEMFGANPVPRSHDSTLEKGKRGFDGIGVNVAHDVHARTVVNLLVVRPVSFSHRSIVSGCIVGEDYFHVLGDVLADVLSKRSALRITGMKETEIAIALADADNHFFVIHTGDSAFAFVPAANIGNVHLDLAIQHRFIGLRHGVSDAMAEVPCRFVTHSDCALNLTSGHAFLGFAEQMCSEEPFAEWEMGIVKYGAGCNGKLVVAVFAVEELLVSIQLDHGAFAAQALWAFREAETHEQFAALVFRAEQGIYIN